MKYRRPLKFFLMFVLFSHVQVDARENDLNCPDLVESTRKYLLDNFRFFENSLNPPDGFKSKIIESSGHIDSEFDRLSECSMREISESKVGSQEMIEAVDQFRWVQDFGTFSANLNVLSKRIRSGNVDSDEELKFEYEFLKNSFNEIMSSN